MLGKLDVLALIERVFGELLNKEVYNRKEKQAKWLVFSYVIRKLSSNGKSITKKV